MPATPRKFMIGTYEIRTERLPGAANMQRYRVFSGGRLIGTSISMPSESDCVRFEKPVPVPPLKPFQITHRAGRPKKGAATRSADPAPLEQRYTIPREDLPLGAPTPDTAKSEDR